MIRRNRKKEAPPKDLVDANCAGPKELAKVKAWMDSGAPAKDPPVFKAYKALSVSIGLERLFMGKCAYCESPYSRTQPVDIEHWRPKAAVVGASGKAMGYPWLAMVWENLLPSCIDCNRARNQKVFRPDASGKLQEMQVLQGKANQFPLADEKRRIKSYKEDPAVEQPLLLDPCTDDPARYFLFDENGVILPKDGHPSDAQAKLRRARALASIEVYALNRKGLVDERKERILLLRSRFALITTLAQLEAGTKESATRELAHAMIDSEIEKLISLQDARQPYSLLTTQFVQEFLTALKTP